VQALVRDVGRVAGFVEEGGEDGAVGAVFGAGGADGDVGFEDGEADGGGCHGGVWWGGGRWVGGGEVDEEIGLSVDWIPLALS